MSLSSLSASVRTGSPSAAHLEFTQRALLAIMVVAAVAAAMFGLMSELGLNDIGPFHARVDFVYCAVSLLLVELRRRGLLSLNQVLQLFLLCSFLTFISALVNVPSDQFRGIWFFLLVFVAFVLGGSVTGVAYALLSVLAFVLAAATLDLQLNPETLVSMGLGLVIFGALSFVYARQSSCYADLVETKNQQLEYLASRDALTGILNNRSYESQGAALFAVAKRSGQALSLMYLDVDHFKQINDRYGHHVGDQMLVSLVRLVGATVRDSDIFARIGGEEFCVLLPGTELPGARTLAEKVRQMVEAAAFDVDGQAFRMTVSIGVTTLEDTDESLLALEKRADVALYQAKLTGRNRVCVAGN